MIHLWCFYRFWTTIAPGDHMHSLYVKGHTEEIKSWSRVNDDRIFIIFNSMWSVTYYPNVPKQHIVKELVSVCWKFHRLWACVLFRRQERHPSVSVHWCCCYEYIFILPKISPSPHYLKTERLPKLSETFKRGFWMRLPSTCAWLPPKESII